MKTSIKTVIGVLCALLLAACSGGQNNGATTSAPPPAMLAAVQHVSAQQVSAASYTEVVQRVYVAFFGRPADPAGLAFYTGRYLAVGAPTDIIGLSQAYYSNGGVTSLIDSFGTSQESRDLYPGDNVAFLTAVYHNLYNRDPDAPGQAYWADLLNRGAMTRANAAVAIMAGAQGTDAQLIAMKVQAAGSFTTALDTPTETAAYDGLAANVVVRGMLAGVTLATDVNNFQPTINATISALIAAEPPPPPPPPYDYAPVAAIIQQRCAACHSAHPTIAAFSPAPLGIMFDTSAQIHAQSGLIYANAVQTQNMPYGNLTHMTDAERAVLGQWIAAGAP